MRRIVLATLVAIPRLVLAQDGSDVATCQNPAAAPDRVVRACTAVADTRGIGPREEARALLNLAAAHVELGNVTLARATLDRAALRDPRLAPIYTERGYVRARLGDIDGAFADYDRAIAMDPRGADARMGRGTLALRQGDPARALEDFDALVRHNPRDADAWFNRGLAEAARGRMAEAVRSFSTVLTLAPEDAGAWLERGRAQAGTATGPALADMTRAIEIAPEWPDAFVARGQLHDAAGRREAADRDFLRAFELGYQAGWLTERVAALRGG